MAARKLQGEIDRVLKQIGEHMQEFDQIWSEPEKEKQQGHGGCSRSAEEVASSERC